MRFGKLSLLLCLGVLIVSPKTIAQGADRSTCLMLSLMDAPPAEFVTVAFAEPYGRALATESGAVEIDSADSECVLKSGYSKEQLASLARTMLVRSGIYAWTALIGMIDRKKLNPMPQLGSVKAVLPKSPV